MSVWTYVTSTSKIQNHTVTRFPLWLPDPWSQPWAGLGPGQAAPASGSLRSSRTFDPQDIVTESNKFDLVGFIPLLRERIYSNNQYARQFIISWVRAGPTHFLQP